jgi:hypothetical protein
MQTLQGVRRQKISPLAATLGILLYGVILFGISTGLKGLDPNQTLFIQIFAGAALADGFIKYMNYMLRQDPNEELLAKLDEQKLMLQQVLDKLNQSP